MREWIISHRAGLTASIVGTLAAIYFIEPILTGTARLMMTIATFLGSTYVDRIYAQVAHLETIDHAYIIAATLLGSAAAILLTVAITLIRAVFVPIKSDKERRRKVSTAQVLAAAVAAILVAMFIIGTIASNYWQLQIITTFKRDMRVIAPFIDDEEEERILSRWSLMKGESDYEKIYDDLHEIAQRNSVELPENAIYSPYAI